MAKKVTLPKGCYRVGDTVKIDKTFHDIRICATMHRKTDKEIDDYVKSRIRDIEAGDFDNRSLTVHDALNNYWEEHLKHKKYGEDWKSLLTTLDRRLGDKIIYRVMVRGGRHAIDCLVKNDIEDYKTSRSCDLNKKCEPISPRTLQADLSLLCAAIDHAVANNLVDRNPIKSFCRVPQPSAKKIIMDDGCEYGFDYRALLREIIDDESRDRIKMLYETGMRPSELWKMTDKWIKKITDDCWLIEVPHDQEKTGTYKRIPLSSQAQAIIAIRLAIRCNGLLFPSADSGEVKYFRRPFCSAIERAGLKGKEYTLYCLRRTRATIWDAIDSDASRYALGHSPTDSHRRNYVRITDERLFRLVGKVLSTFKKDADLGQIYNSEIPRRFCVENGDKSRQNMQILNRIGANGSYFDN
jgi:integrase